ncbi:hypothetical protein ACVW01_000615 [Thermostichus sp. MS-CIW-19]|jgi:hypothetical protein
MFSSVQRKCIRLIPQLNYRYPLKRERFPKGLRPAIQKLPVLLLAS